MINNADNKHGDSQTLIDATLHDPSYFGNIMQRYEPKLMAYIMRHGIEKEDAQDILQESFIKSYRYLASLSDATLLDAYMYRITKSVLYDTLRKRQRRPHVLGSQDAEKLFLVLASEEDIAQRVRSQDNAKEVHAVLSKMKPKYQEVLILYYLEEKTQKEISDILKKPPGTVASLVNRAQKSFKIHWNNLHSYDQK